MKKSTYIPPHISTVKMGLEDDILDGILYSDSYDASDDDRVKGEIHVTKDGETLKPQPSTLWDEEW